MLRSFLFAVSFLTRIPLPARFHEVSSATLSNGPLYFPLVGGLIGLVTGLLCLGLNNSLPVMLSIAIALAVEALLTGAMHEDALADSADALGGGWTRERTLEIFKDSRLGTYGVLALVLGVAIRALAMATIAHQSGQWSSWLVMFFLAGAGGRWQMVLFLKTLPPIRGRASLSGQLGDGLSWGGIALGALPMLACLPFLLGAQVHSFAIAFVLLLAGHALGHVYLKRRLGGSTGDLLGAVAFIAQLIWLVALAAR